MIGLSGIRWRRRVGKRRLDAEPPADEERSRGRFADRREHMGGRRRRPVARRVEHLPRRLHPEVNVMRHDDPPPHRAFRPDGGSGFPSFLFRKARKRAGVGLALRRGLPDQVVTQLRPSTAESWLAESLAPCTSTMCRMAIETSPCARPLLCGLVLQERNIGVRKRSKGADTAVFARASSPPRPASPLRCIDGCRRLQQHLAVGFGRHLVRLRASTWQRLRRWHPLRPTPTCRVERRRSLPIQLASRVSRRLNPHCAGRGCISFIGPCLGRVMATRTHNFRGGWLPQPRGSIEGSGGSCSERGWLRS